MATFPGCAAGEIASRLFPAGRDGRSSRDGV